MALTREQILAASDIKTQEVQVPEWGGSVLVRALNVKEQNDWRRGMLRSIPKSDPKTHKTFFEFEFDQALAELSTVKMLVLACVDEGGARLFTDSDIERLMQKGSEPVARLVKVIKEISGLNDDSAEEAEKNSEASPSV